MDMLVSRRNGLNMYLLARGEILIEELIKELIAELIEELQN